MKNFNKTQKVVDGYVYNFYGDIDYRNEMVAYAQMSKRFMNKPFNSPLDIVGNFDWHQEFRYEEFLGFHTTDKEAKVIDFGCGPGRMVERAGKLFPIVDGIDISEYAIAYARQHFPRNHFYISSGIDVGETPEDYYDLVFSTIAIQHIPCKTIRTNIFRGIHNILKPGGVMSIQVAYNANQQAGVWSPDTEHASYDSDFWNAKATNGHADMVINAESLPKFQADLSEIFKDVSYKLVNVDKLYANLNGRYHANYWASDWLFVKGTKE